jgi:hypothetical protein
MRRDKIRNFSPAPDTIVRELGPYAGVVFGIVYRYSLKYGYCTAAQDTIAKKLNMNRSTVNKYLQMLAKHDPPYIEDLDDGVHNKPHRYRAIKNFDFFVDFAVEDTDTSERGTVGETDTAVDNTDMGVEDTDLGVGETNPIKELKKEFKKEIEDSIDPKAKTAWQHVLAQQELDMQKATFDHYLKESVVVSYDNGCFAIGVRDGLRAEWLNARMISTVTGLLAGMMDRSVEARFCVW